MSWIGFACLGLFIYFLITLHYNYLRVIPDMRFLWDQKKDLTHIKKHNISFEEAKTVFFDDNARLIPDPEHSISEERFIILGITNKLRLLVVVHSYNENDDTIRIISARKATKSESKYYCEVK